MAQLIIETYHIFADISRSLSQSLKTTCTVYGYLLPKLYLFRDDFICFCEIHHYMKRPMQYTDFSMSVKIENFSENS